MSINKVKCITRKFKKTNSLDVAPGRGRHVTTESSGNLSNATVNGRSIARALGIPWATMCMILRKILKLYSYKMHIVQQLKPQDHSERLDFALRFLARMQVNEYSPSHIL